MLRVQRVQDSRGLGVSACRVLGLGRGVQRVFGVAGGLWGGSEPGSRSGRLLLCFRRPCPSLWGICLYRYVGISSLLNSGVDVLLQLLGASPGGVFGLSGLEAHES